MKREKVRLILLEATGEMMEIVVPNIEYMTIDLANKVPTESGIYIFKNDSEEIVYVGKAKRLRSRIRDHLGGFTNTYHCYKEFKSVGYFLEDDALKRSVYESVLILKNKPCFNSETPSYQQGFGAKREYIQKPNNEPSERKELIKRIGSKNKVYDVVSFVRQGYNPHMISQVFGISIEDINLIKQQNFRLPNGYKPSLTHRYFLDLLLPNRDISARLSHLVG